MAIVKYRNQSGALYAYDQTSEWDPIRKQSKSKRVFLGRVDEETGEIIKTKRKKKPKPEGDETGEKTSPDFQLLYNDAASRVKELEKKLTDLELTNLLLQEENRKAKKILETIHKLTGNEN